MFDIKTGVIDGTFASDMLDMINAPANIKDAATRKYTNSNELNLRIYGVTLENFIGKTMQDFHPKMKEYWGEDYADYIDNLDNQVINKNQLLIDVIRTISDADGKVRVQKMIKVPIVRNNQTLAIFSFCHNVKLGIRRLYEQYKLLHPKNKKTAVVKFLEHLKLTTYFLEIPTDAELNVLIERVIYSRNKELSASLFLTTKTIEAHLLSLRHKVHNEDLLALLSIMRNLEIDYI